MFLSSVYNFEGKNCWLLFKSEKKINLNLTKEDHTSKVNKVKHWEGQEFTWLSGTWSALETGHFHRMLYYQLCYMEGQSDASL